MSPPAAPVTAWRELGEPRPETLVGPRLQLHRAAQIVSAFAHTYVEKTADDSHTSLEWLAPLGVLAGRPNAVAPAVRLALEPAALDVLVLDAGGEELRRFELDGLTIDAAYDRVEASLHDLFGAGRAKSLVRPVLELPPGRGAGREPFGHRPAAAFAELARWYADADLLLERVAGAIPGASEIRCWPHHFDIAFVVPVERGAGAEAGSIGVGMTPGDDSYAVPYWYVTPYPYPEPPPQPDLAGGGVWQVEDFYGAVLPADRLVRARQPAAQFEQAESFLLGAIAAGREIVAAADE